MNTSISLNRMWLLTKAIGGQNWSRDWKFFLVVFVVLTLSKVMNAGWCSVLPFVVILILLYLAGTTYSLFNDSKHGMFYATMPVSTAEKFIVNASFVHIYYVLAFMVISIASYYLGSLLHQVWISRLQEFPLVSEGMQSVKFGKNFGESILALIAAQSVLMFGSVYFKRHAILKTILALGVIFAAFFVIDASIFFSIFKNWSYVAAGTDEKMLNVDALCYLILSLTTIYFWVMTYLCLKETEV